MASLDYIAGKPFEINQDVLSCIIIALKIDIAEKKGLPEEDIEHEAYKKLSEHYWSTVKGHFKALQLIGADVNEFLNSAWYKGMYNLVTQLDSKALEIQQKQ
jgi:hypothetical protein